MIFGYFFISDSMYHNVGDIYDQHFLSIISPIMHYTSIITIIFTTILIYIIIKKTPKQMASFKTYLLPYIFNALMLEIAMLLYKPLFLHPYFAMLSLDSMIQHSHQSSLIMFILILYFAMSLVDCIAGMSAERYYAIRNTDILRHSKKPLIIFGALFLSNLAFLVGGFVGTFFVSLPETIFISQNQTLNYLHAHLIGSENIPALGTSLFFRTDQSQLLMYGAGAFLAFAFLRYITASVFLILNVTTSVKSSSKISRKLQKNNTMLLRCTYIQFSGFVLLAGLPTVTIVAALVFIQEPTKITTFAILMMNSFGLYDTFVTIICIKPYRMFFFKLFKDIRSYDPSYESQTRNRITSIPSIL